MHCVCVVFCYLEIIGVFRVYNVGLVLHAHDGEGLLVGQAGEIASKCFCDDSKTKQ